LRIRNINLKSILVFSVVILMISTTINYFFLFNPLTFSKDSITPNDWYDYKKPIEIAYLYWDTNKGWVETKVVKSVKETLFIVNELKKENDVKYSIKEYLIPYEKRGRECWVMIRQVINKPQYYNRRQISKVTYWNMTQFHYLENGDIAELGDNTYIKLTEKLKALLLSRL
jgi:hypothetical protein